MSDVGDPRRWRDAVVVCAANSWDAPVRLHDRQLAQRLAERVPVLYVDPPLSLAGPLRRGQLRRTLAEPRLRLVGDRLARLTPVAPPLPLRPGMAPVTAALLRRSLRRAVRALGGGRPWAVVATSPLLPVLGACRESRRVWWAQDDLAAGAALLGLSGRRLAAGDVREGLRADVIVAANPLLAEGWAGRGRRAALVPYGCDEAAYAAVDEAPLPADVTLPRPIAGFVGHVGDRIDVRLLEAVAERGRSLLLVGPRHGRSEGAGLAALLARPNVQWVGGKRYEDLPSYLRVIDAGLVPYSRSGFNLGSFPLKTLEYLAAGRPVVATDLPAHRWLATDLIEIAGEPEAFAGAVDRALDAPADPRAAARRRAFAAAHGWAARADAFARAIGHPAVAAPDAGGAASRRLGVAGA